MNEPIEAKPEWVEIGQLVDGEIQPYKVYLERDGGGRELGLQFYIVYDKAAEEKDLYWVDADVTNADSCFHLLTRSKGERVQLAHTRRKVGEVKGYVSRMLVDIYRVVAKNSNINATDIVKTHGSLVDRIVNDLRSHQSPNVQS